MTIRLGLAVMLCTATILLFSGCELNEQKSPLDGQLNTIHDDSYQGHKSSSELQMQQMQQIQKVQKETNTKQGQNSGKNPIREPMITENQTIRISEPPADFRHDKALPRKTKVKGIYVPGWIAGGKKLDELINLLNQSELNAMVIDVKNDNGQLTYDSNISTVNEIGADRNRNISDMAALVKKLKKNDIYLIGRIVTFKDPYLAAKRSSWAMRNKSGGLWKDNQGVAWVDPYKAEVWQYNMAIAVEAAKLGFDEIQFDYVRFPDNAKKVDREVHFDNPKHWSKGEVISQFLASSQTLLHKHGVFVSADVFGLTTSTSDDMGIGQQWGKVTQAVDYICPMVYPSHYSPGMYGIRYPDLDPHGIVEQASIDAKRKNNTLKQQGLKTAIIRPWLQDFTATWVKPHQIYGYKQVIAQIKAANEQGIDEFLLWDAKVLYSLWRKSE
jgi:hypothetical protein